MATDEHRIDPVKDPDVAVAVYPSESELTDAVNHLEQARLDTSKSSVLGSVMTQEWHIVGFETPGKQAERWAK
jgi:hypothetical protein